MLCLTAGYRKVVPNGGDNNNEQHNNQLCRGEVHHGAAQRGVIRAIEVRPHTIRDRKRRTTTDVG